MSRSIAYLDSSAIVKLVVAERETDALRQALAPFAAQCSSRLAAVEVRRATRRYAPHLLGTAEAVLGAMVLFELGDEVLELAGAVGASTLRALDAIHLATAMLVGSDLGALFAYDQRLLEAAAEVGLPVLSPS